MTRHFSTRETFLIRKVSTISMKISEKILTQSSRGLMPGPDHPHQNTSGRILRYFALETNIEGINNAGRSRSLVRASVWLGIFLIFLALTVSDMTDLIRGPSTLQANCSCISLLLPLQSSLPNQWMCPPPSGIRTP